MFTIVNMLLSWFLFFLAVPVSHKKSTVVDSEGMLNFSVCYRGNKECRIENSCDCEENNHLFSCCQWNIFPQEERSVFNQKKL